jgi:hypothetical protein
VRCIFIVRQPPLGIRMAIQITLSDCFWDAAGIGKDGDLSEEGDTGFAGARAIRGYR